MRCFPTTVVTGSDYITEVINILDHLDRILQENQSILTTDPDDRLVFWSPEIVRRAVPNKGLGNVIGRVILDATSRAEIIGAGAGEITLRLIVNLSLFFLRQLRSGDDFQKLIHLIQNDSDCFQDFIQEEVRWPDLCSLQNLLERLSHSERELAIVKEAIDLAGLEGRIFVEVTNSSRSSVELILDYVFRLSPSPEVIGLDETWHEKEVRCVLIDGVVESVSEIHRLLTAASQHREPCLLFCRGFSEEVISTLALNRKRRTLNVIPVQVPFDVEFANTLKDLAVILGTDIVTSLQGQLISSIKWEDLIVIPEAKWQSGILSIRTGGDSCRVLAHLAELLRHRSELPLDARRDILDKRIRSLTTSAVEIRVGGQDAQEMAKRIDLLLRTVRSVISYGLVDIDRLRLRWSSKDSFLRRSLDQAIVASDFFGLRPAITVAIAMKYGVETAISIANIAAAILLDL